MSTSRNPAAATYRKASAQAHHQLDSADEAAEAGGSLDWLAVIGRADWLVTYACSMRQAAVDQARADACTWAEIGEALSITRQAAHERFATTRDRRSGLAAATHGQATRTLTEGPWAND